MKLQIVDFTEMHQPYFEKFNRDWIEQYFWLEDVDRYVLQQPKEAIIDKGGAILMALYDGAVAGTVALKKISPELYEFTKMAVDAPFRRKGIAEALSYSAFEKAKELGAKKVILYSQTGLVPAITMYRKLGFIEVPMDHDLYKRSDIKMEIDLEQITIPG